MHSAPNHVDVDISRVLYIYTELWTRRREWIMPVFSANSYHGHISLIRVHKIRVIACNITEGLTVYIRRKRFGARYLLVGIMFRFIFQKLRWQNPPRVTYYGYFLILNDLYTHRFFWAQFNVLTQLHVL